MEKNQITILIDIPDLINNVSLPQFLKSTQLDVRWYQDYYSMEKLRSLIYNCDFAETNKLPHLGIRYDVLELLTEIIKFPKQGYNQKAFQFLPFMDLIIKEYDQQNKNK